MTDSTTNDITTITSEELQKIVVAAKIAQKLGAYRDTEQSNELSEITHKVIALLNCLDDKEKKIVVNNNDAVEIK